MPSSEYPALDEPIRRLMYVGALFTQRARDWYGLYTMRQLRDLMATQSKGQNRTFLAEWLENPRRGECVPPPKQRKNYSVRPFNEYAYTSVVNYMRHRDHLDTQRIPASLKRRPMRIAHPRRCAENG